jgi:hypothetical protein
MSTINLLVDKNYHLNIWISGIYRFLSGEKIYGMERTNS